MTESEEFREEIRKQLYAIREDIQRSAEKTEHRMSHIDTSVQMMRNTLIGNKDYKQPGLVDLVQKHEEYINDDRKWKNKIWGGAAVISVIATLASQYIQNIKNVFIK